jgi:RNA polymerase sigma-70 factor, ECF subfamily
MNIAAQAPLLPISVSICKDAASQRLALWLAAVAKGDHRAFRALYDATNKRLLAIAMEVLPQTERAEEVLQEAYVKVWRGAAQFDAELARPMTWLMRLVRNTAIDHLRAGRAEAQLTEPLGPDLIDSVADAARGPEQQWQQASVMRCLDAALLQLGRAERQAVARVLYQSAAVSYTAQEAVKAQLQRPGCGTAQAGLAQQARQAALPLRRAVLALRKRLNSLADG